MYVIYWVKTLNFNINLLLKTFNVFPIDYAHDLRLRKFQICADLNEKSALCSEEFLQGQGLQDGKSHAAVILNLQLSNSSLLMLINFNLLIILSILKLRTS